MPLPRGVLRDIQPGVLVGTGGAIVTKADISGGSDGVGYRVRNKVTLGSGAVYERTLRVLVREL